MSSAADDRGEVDARIFFVLGMHRSGTSCLMACLETCGVEVGNVQRFNVNQPRGNLEQAAVMALNERLLGAAGGTWRDPPRGGVVPRAEDLIEMAGVLAGLRATGPGAVKDPRLLLTIGAWLSTGVRPELIGTFRHPAAVAASLRERDGMTSSAAFELWRHYNERLVALHRTQGFPLVEFDLSDHEAYCRVVAAVAAERGLVPRVGAIEAVVERVGARSALDAHGPVPDGCGELYEYLRAHRHSGRVESGTPAADRLAVGLAHPATGSFSVRQALARRMWLTSRASPRPVRILLRPMQRATVRILRHLPPRR